MMAKALHIGFLLALGLAVSAIVEKDDIMEAAAVDKEVNVMLLQVSHDGQLAKQQLNRTSGAQKTSEVATLSRTLKDVKKHNWEENPEFLDHVPDGAVAVRGEWNADLCPESRTFDFKWSKTSFGDIIGEYLCCDEEIAIRSDTFEEEKYPNGWRFLHRNT